MTVNYVYLGYGTTDENGECKLDHDANGDSISHSYTGTGAGKIDVVASLDSPSSISDSSLVSETYSLWDYIKYDYGTQSNHNDIWTPTTSTPTLTRGDDYSTISEGTGIYAEYRTQIVNQDCVIEGDARNDIQLGWILSIVQGTSQLTGCGLGQYDAWVHFKIVIQGSTVTLYLNNSSTPTLVRQNINRDTSKPLYFAFATPQSITTIDFKDFKVYPI